MIIKRCREVEHEVVYLDKTRQAHSQLSSRCSLHHSSGVDLWVLSNQAHTLSAFAMKGCIYQFTIS